MVLNREFKIGIAFLAALVILVVGLNFLKGVNVFRPTNHFYAYYSTVDGLAVSNAVYIKGYKVGQVKTIRYDFKKNESFCVEISINKDIELPEGTVMQVREDGMMGGKVIDLILPENRMENGKNYESGATLKGTKAVGLMDLLSDLVPKADNTITQLDSVVTAVKEVMNGRELNNTLASLEQTSNDLRVSSAKLKVFMSQDMPQLMTNVNGVVGDLKHITGNLQQTDFEALFARIDGTVAKVDKFAENLNNPNGTLGALINDRTLYDKVNRAVGSADTLLIDLRQNPRRYVHFSLWGKKNKKKDK